MNTFEIRQEYIALSVLLNEVDEETGEFINSKEDIQEYVDSLEASRDEKLINIERYKRDIKGQSTTIAEEIKRLQGLKKSCDNQVERLTELEFTLTNGEKIDVGLYKFSTRKSESVKTPDEVDPTLERFVKTTHSWDKTAIKKALKEGIDYSEYGLELVQKETLSVR
jgi:predicted phage-related endonuclease